MPDSDFEIGDIVMLKSGGPPMTVHLVQAAAVTCVWFDANEEHQKLKFTKNTLRHCDSEDGKNQIV